MNTPVQSQPSLLDEIVRIATDSQQSLTVLLRKCLILAYQLNNNELKIWLKKELDGYSSSDALPSYRIVQGVGALGNFSDGYHPRNSVPLPSGMLRKEHRERAESVPLTEAVSSYEDSLSRGSDHVTFFWPANLIAVYQYTFYGKGVALLNAWQNVPKGVIVQLLNGVRNRILTMALELQSDFGSKDLTKISPAEIIKASQAITQVFHGPTIIASGHAQVTLNANKIIAGDWKQLGAVLKSYGLTDQDLKELSEAEEADGDQKMGEKTTGWIKNAALKVVGVGADIAKDVLTAYLRQYLGLP